MTPLSIGIDLSLTGLASGAGGGSGPLPSNSVKPAVSGTTTQFSTLTSTQGTWANAATYAYQWYQALLDGSNNAILDGNGDPMGTPISGATASTFALRTADVAQRIFVRVTATGTGGSKAAYSVASALIAAALHLDFSTGSVPGSVSFTRSTVARYYSSAGFDTSAAIDGARFDYDPVTHAGPTLLIEPAATNLQLQSRTFANWSNSGTAFTRTAAAATGPDNTSSAWYIKRGATGSNFQIGPISAAITGVNQVTFSMIAKSATLGGFLAMRLQGTFPSGGAVTFNLATGAFQLFTTNYSGTAAFATSLGNGWWLLELVTTSDSTGVQSSYYSPTDAIGSQIDTGTAGLDDCYVYHAQLELGARASSPVVTIGGTVTRAADAAALTVPTGASNLVYTFDDASTQTVAVSPGAYTIPTTLNRRHIKLVDAT